MVVGVLQLTLYFAHSRSLKEKRGLVRSVKSRVANEFNVSIAECDGHDLWQKAVFGICRVGADLAYVEGCLRKVVAFIGDLHLGELGEERVEFLHYK